VGTSSPTWITASWLSSTITEGAESTFTRESLAKALSTARTAPVLSMSDQLKPEARLWMPPVRSMPVVLPPTPPTLS
jgi:hypothetical protein